MGGAHDDDDADVADPQHTDRMRNCDDDFVALGRGRLDLAQARFSESSMRVVSQTAYSPAFVFVAYGASEDCECATAIWRGAR